MSKNQIHIPGDISPYPSEHEISAAIILSDYFDADITFIKRSHMHTSDFLIKNQIWEHKSPIGDGKRTIQNNLRRADDQSPYVVLDLRRCKMNQTRAESRIRHEISQASKIRKLLVIRKNEKVVAIK